jgi:hypothetical protein
MNRPSRDEDFGAASPTMLKNGFMAGGGSGGVLRDRAV